MQATRQDILDHLRRHGQASVRELGDLLGLTSTGIRQHLTILERDGLIRAREERGRVGRPALVFSLTKQGDALYPKRYDMLAGLLLDEIKTMTGSKGLQGLMQRVALRLAEPLAVRMEEKSLPERVQEASRILEEQGCLVDAVTTENDYLIIRHTCPFPDVALNHSCVCALDVEFLRFLLRADTRLTSCLVRGDSSCTYRIRPAPSRPQRPYRRQR
jgi:predicted ArsR family transcriptional regulator